ncbi:hypothetical protein OKW35_003159 [Paraburkholderia sp. MM5477-R1]
MPALRGDLLRVMFALAHVGARSSHQRVDVGRQKEGDVLRIFLQAPKVQALFDASPYGAGCKGALSVGLGTITQYLQLATAAGLGWASVEHLEEDELERRVLSLASSPLRYSTAKVISVSGRGHAQIALSQRIICYMGHVLTDNRHGLVVNAQVTLVTGTAERDCAAQMLADAAKVAPGGITVGADKNYDTAGFVATCRANRVTPHVAQNDGRPGGSAIDERTTRVGRVTRSASKNVSGLSRCSDGARQSDEFDRRCIEDLNAWTSSSC